MRFVLAAILLYGASFSVASAEVVITEIMYDLPGSDTDREWVEIQNTGASSVDLSDWRFNDGTNHLLVIEEKGGQGSLTLSAGEYAVLASDAAVFLSEYGGFSGTVIDTVMSLGQQDDRTYTLSIIRDDSSTEDSVSYTTSLDARGDGNSLQLAGGVLISALPTPGALNSSQPSPPENTNEEEESEENSSSGGDTTPSYSLPPIEERIYADAGEDRTVIVGVDSVFEGEGLGVEKEPLGETARYLWNFGNGKTAEGKSVFHHYEYPGTYVVMLTVASGKLNTTDRISVQAVPSEISITEATSEFVKLENKGLHEVNLSRWYISTDWEHFPIPGGTIILPNNSLTFSHEVTELTVSSPSHVRLLYPNGTEAVQYEEIALEVPTTVNEFTTQELINTPPTSLEPEAVFSEEDTSVSEETGIADEQAAAVADVVPNNSDVPLYTWLLALFGVIGVGVVAAIIFRREKENEIKIIE